MHMWLEGDMYMKLPDISQDLVLDIVERSGSFTLHDCRETLLLETKVEILYFVAHKQRDCHNLSECKRKRRQLFFAGVCERVVCALWWPFDPFRVCSCLVFTI